MYFRFTSRESENCGTGRGRNGKDFVAIGTRPWMGRIGHKLLFICYNRNSVIISKNPGRMVSLVLTFPYTMSRSSEILGRGYRPPKKLDRSELILERHCATDPRRCHWSAPGRTIRRDRRG